MPFFFIVLAGVRVKWIIPNLSEIQFKQIVSYELSARQDREPPEQWQRMALMKALQLPMGCSLSNVTLFRNLANKIELINYKNFKNCSLFVATGIFSASRLLFYAVVNFLTAHPAKFCPWCLTDDVIFLSFHPTPTGGL